MGNSSHSVQGPGIMVAFRGFMVAEDVSDNRMIDKNPTTGAYNIK